MKKIHELHNHPMTEYRENIPKDKVLVDKEFGWLFSQTWEYWDDNHVIVLRSEFDKLRMDMNREEEIKQEAFKVAGVNPDWGLVESFRIGFIEGARWADRNKAKTKIICLRDKTKVCNQCHDCDY